MVISWPWQICHLFFRVSNPWIVFGILNFRFLADCLTLEEAYSSLGILCWHLNWNSVTGIWNSFPQRMRLRRSVTLPCKTKRMKNCKTVLKAFHQFLRIEQSGNEVVLGGRTFQLSIKSSLFTNTLKPLLLLFLQIPIINGQPKCVFWLQISQELKPDQSHFGLPLHR